MTDQDGRLVSVVVPAHNEEATVARFVELTAKAFAQLGRPWELLYVDDGSTDGTAAAVQAAARAEPRVRLVRQRRNLGLTEALNRGFREAHGAVIVFLPADLESDPEIDVPLLLDKLDEGYDVVAGWRQGRRDGKRFASRLANVTCRALFGLDVHDMNWIKAFRREVTDSLALRSSWHRYILVMAHNEGWRIGEVKVPYEPRRAGRSKFGFSRLPVSFLDVVTLKFLLTFQRRPAIFFGALGSGMIGAGVLLWAYLLWSFVSSHTQYRPLMLVAGIAVLAGLLVVLVGPAGGRGGGPSGPQTTLPGIRGRGVRDPAGLVGAHLAARHPLRPLLEDEGRRRRRGPAQLRHPAGGLHQRRLAAERVHPVGGHRQLPRAARPLPGPAGGRGRAGAAADQLAGPAVDPGGRRGLAGRRSGARLQRHPAAVHAAGGDRKSTRLNS